MVRFLVRYNGTIVGTVASTVRTVGTIFGTMASTVDTSVSEISTHHHTYTIHYSRPRECALWSSRQPSVQRRSGARCSSPRSTSWSRPFSRRISQTVRSSTWTLPGSKCRANGFRECLGPNIQRYKGCRCSILVLFESDTMLRAGLNCKCFSARSLHAESDTVMMSMF